MEVEENISTDILEKLATLFPDIISDDIGSYAFNYNGQFYHLELTKTLDAEYKG